MNVACALGLTMACADPSTPLAAFTAPTPILVAPQPAGETPTQSPEPPRVAPVPAPEPPPAPAPPAQLVHPVRCTYVANAIGDPNTFPVETPLNFWALDGIGPFTWSSDGIMKDTRPDTRQYIDLWLKGSTAGIVTVKDVTGETSSCRIGLSPARSAAP